jgi:hypothetical protein
MLMQWNFDAQQCELDGKSFMSKAQAEDAV